MKKRTKKSIKLARSNAAHGRLERKYAARSGIKAKIRETYHFWCVRDQGIRGRVLNRQEKRHLFNLASKRVTHKR